MEENIAATELSLTSDDLSRIEAVAPKGIAAGLRYSEAFMKALNH